MIAQCRASRQSLDVRDRRDAGGSREHTVSKPDIDMLTDYKRQTRDAYISRLRSRELIDDERGAIKARAMLFEGS